MVLLTRTFLMLFLLSLVACASVQQHQQLQSAQSTQAAQIGQQANALQLQHEALSRMASEIDDVKVRLATLQSDIQSLEQVSRQPQTPAPSATVIEEVAAPFMPRMLATPDKAVLGWVEWARIELVDGYLKARIDTGAKSSSIHATRIEFFERDGESWVRFGIDSHEKSEALADNTTTYEAPVVRVTRIKQEGGEKTQERPVIRLFVAVGEISDEIEFTLADRAGMNYPVLLGRNFLADVAVVDVSKVFTRKRAGDSVDATGSAP